MTAYKEGIRNLAAWSYQGTGCMSYLASDDPVKVWQVLGESFGRICKIYNSTDERRLDPSLKDRKVYPLGLKDTR